MAVQGCRAEAGKLLCWGNYADLRLSTGVIWCVIQPLHAEVQRITGSIELSMISTDLTIRWPWFIQLEDEARY